MNILFFILGLIVGSFLNCVIYRMELQEDMPKGSPQRKAVSFLRGKSFCPNCRHELAWSDLVPVFSFLLLKGKCRYCGKKISWQYPVVEILTAFLFLAVFSQFSLINSVFLAVIFSLLLVIFVFDLKHFIIPDRVLFLAIITAFLYNLFLNYGNMFNFIYSAFLASGFFLLIFIISKGRWIGFGDVKFAFFMGLFLGFPGILIAFYFAFTIGAIIGVGLIVAKRKEMKSEIPFGPFLIIGTLSAFFYGNQIINWYFNLLG